ncbi:solute carrier family 15 member 4-like [Lingula anatina]|uniref:Solute carrier family 15 member 4-like n=1 Tax=Lingula anatina TaxID=7574 RepID=A0A1S3IXE3_LINAN|nr:solute carrier family 15 member 4-like [Lingula anatina]|eukprot:XP_013402646.1 solute carrier family 15 member 4-like [Lingula anatina]
MRHSRGSADIQQEQQEIRPILTQQREIQHKNIFGVYDVQAAELLLHHDILINDELLSLHLWMQTYNIGAVLTMIPLCFYVIYPLIERKRGKPNRLLVKIGAGLAIACLSSLVAVVVEFGRCSRPKPVKNLTVHVQAPIFLLLGLSQVFVAIAGLEFAYGLVPRALPGLAVGIWYAAMGIGSFTMQILYQISRYVFEKEGRATSCYPEDQRTEIFFHLDYYFITFFVISLVNFAFFVLISLKATRIGGYNDTPEGCLDDQFSHSYELQARRRGSNTAQYS